MDPTPGRLPPEVDAIVPSIRLVAFDFDGVFTDNTVFVFQDGREAVRCWRSDGIGLSRLRADGLELVILSTETNPVVLERSKKLAVPCVHGLDDKGAALEKLLAEKGLRADQAAYVGNDINDIPCLDFVALPIVVKDAHPDTLAHARYRTRAPGGRGAVREICDLFIRVRAGLKP